MGNAPDCLDQEKSAAGSVAMINVLDPLITIDNKGRYVGNLATSWKSSAGGLKLTFQLRKGVRFSNGDPFTAQAVKYTYDRAKDPATKSALLAGQLRPVTAIKVVSKYVVELDLSGPYRPLLTALSYPQGGILDPKAPPTCDSVIGTGAYKIQSTGSGLSTLTLVANKYRNWAPSWIHNKGVPYISKLSYSTAPNDSTAVSELLAGQIDIDPAVSGAQLGRLTGGKQFIIHKVPLGGEAMIEVDTANKPFDTVAARKAFAEIINRAAIIKAAYSGLGKPAYSALAPTIPDHDTTADKLTPHYNLADATKLVQQNHLTGPYTFGVASDDPQATTMGEIIQATAAQAGMQIQVRSLEFGSLLQAAGKGELDGLTFTYGGGYPDPDILYLLFDPSQGGGQGLNFTNFNDPALHNGLNSGRLTLNPKKAKALYAKVQQLLAKQAVAYGVVAPVNAYVLRARINGFHVNKLQRVAFQDLYVKTK